jgi:hypothetical protein
MGPTSSGPGAVSNNGPVKYWGNKASTTFNQTNSGADSVCPTFIANGQNGRSLVRFDGGDRLSNSTATVLNPETRTAFVVSKRTGGSGEQCVFDRANDYALTVKVAGGYSFYYQSGGGNPRTNYISTFAASESNAIFSVVAVMQNVGTGSAWLNGVSQTLSTTTTTSAPAQGAFGVGSVGASSSLLFVGDIAEIIIYTAAISASERQRVERYLAAKWGVTL